MLTLHLGVLLGLAWTILALTFLHLKAKAYGKRRLFSKAAGDVVTALGRLRDAR